MNTDTKRHIDAARQVLVGVVPNPTSQIDQITNALIYKFMDDMDQAAIKAGGEPAFFVGDLERYAWTRLMDTRIGNQERMNLYSEALIKFSEARQLPELFRGIFKSAFLPYRSPDVLGLFLKEIDFFDYSHSEELGNAFEYLLSVMGSQGDAGMFRTPRHIIEFIVDVVNPTKDDRVLDPACGTAGFLISAYKHILEQHDGKNDPEKKERPLTPDERKKLMGNFEGYDISPDMVRLSKVNMYLHQFKNPQIVEYNTLADEERWNEKYDVILANPPFMSPKGAGKPHSKFSIDSSRSEVLFVDYIMNHLRPKGRAGIIVPEGIIFQSGTGHKQLRKNLVEDGLYAVVSLPSGVFAPYAGVKTSILLFDAELAKKSQEILFVKIENDGYDLGATKRPISKNDLPDALSEITAYKRLVETGKATTPFTERIKKDLQDIELNTVTIVHAKYTLVKKAHIAESGDYNLSGDRYRAVTDYSNAKWPMVKLSEVIKLSSGRGLTQSNIIDGGYAVYGGNGINGYHNSFFIENSTIVIGRVGAYCGSVHITEPKSWITDNGLYVTQFLKEINTKYLAHTLEALNINQYAKTGGQPSISQNTVYELSIPLPPLEVQEQIVAEIEKRQSEIANHESKIAELRRQISDITQAVWE